VKKIQLTIYMNEADRIGDVPLHEDVVRRLLQFNIAGATVTPGLMGFGKHGKVHRKRLFGVSDDRPVVITAIDDDGRIRPILTELRSIVPEGLITLHEVEVL
jgi:PII-like signaling protein